ncbi:MAG: chromate transporter [Pseudolabrys sp.]
MSDSAGSPPVPPPSISPHRPDLGELFIAFALVSLYSFGGALPWSRRMIVDVKRWMTAEEFNQNFALAQFLPGPNTINFAVVFGSRFGGAPGAAVATAGLMGPPLIIISVLAVLYSRYGELEPLGRFLTGVSAAAAGLLIAAVGKMAAPLFSRRWDWAPAVAILAFVGVAIMRWPLPYVFAVLAPISVALAWFWPGTERR